MDAIINTECGSVPEESKLLTSQGLAALNLLVCLGYDPVNPPLGDLLRREKNLAGDWIILSPIHWQATHNDAMIVAMGNDLQLNENESKSWFKLLGDYLAEDGLELYYYDANTWLLRIDNKPPLNAKPVTHLMNQSLMPELAQLDPTMYWQKFFTECQMFFASQLNTSALNGVWAWGGAKLNNKSSIPVCADEQFIAMAQLCSTKAVLYSSTVRLKELQILLLSNINSLCELHQEEIKKMPVQWYWNNSAYIRSERNWFTRLWRNLTHAH